jgi:hypothetical protein
VNFTGGPRFINPSSSAIAASLSAELCALTRQFPGHRLTQLPDLTHQVRELPLRFIARQATAQDRFLECGDQIEAGAGNLWSVKTSLRGQLRKRHAAVEFRLLAQVFNVEVIIIAITQTILFMRTRRAN